MTLTKEDFEQFKQDYREFQKLLGLEHWQVYFKQKKCDDAFACTYADHLYTATVIFPLKWDDSEQIQNKRAQIRSTARHEALHLITIHLTDAAYNRFSSQKDIESATEEAQRLLEAFLDRWGHN